MTGSKRRPVEYRPITFTCEWCYKESTELHYPGAKPRYHEACKVEAQRAGARVRMQRMRERQAEQTTGTTAAQQLFDNILGVDDALRLVEQMEQNPPARGRGRPRKS